MKHLTSLMLVLGGLAAAACTATDDEASAYAVADTQTVELALSGMT